MPLTNKRSEPETDLTNFTCFLYGGEGIGKTTFVSGIDENVLFFDTEAGTKLLSVYCEPVKDWPTFLTLVDAFLTEEHQFKCLAIDTVGHLIQSCIEYCVKKLGVEHPSEAQWGRGWAAVKKEWTKPIHRLQLSPYGLWFVGHAATREITQAGGTRSRNFTEPEMPGFISKLVLPICDFIFYATQEEEWLTDDNGKKTRKLARVLKTQPDPNFKAKTRLAVQLPSSIPLDSKQFLDVFKTHVLQNKELQTQ